MSATVDAPLQTSLLSAGGGGGGGEGGGGRSSGSSNQAKRLKTGPFHSGANIHISRDTIWMTTKTTNSGGKLKKEFCSLKVSNVALGEHWRPVTKPSCSERISLFSLQQTGAEQGLRLGSSLRQGVGDQAMD